MSAKTMLNEFDAAAVNKLFGALTEAGKAAGADYYLTGHTEEGVRLWHVDGYSPGVFVLEDDFWMFRADCREAS